MSKSYLFGVIRKFPPRRTGATVQLGIRVPEGFRRQLVQAAKSNGRSLNSEVLIRLRSTFPAPEVSAKIAEPPANALNAPGEDAMGELARALIRRITKEP
jgi:hypothetical protein